MSTADCVQKIGKPVWLMRFLLLVNFALLLVFLGPGRSGAVGLALRRTGFGDLIILCCQIWFIGSTLVATALFMIVGWRKRNTPEGSSPRMILEGTLLLAWWATVL